MTLATITTRFGFEPPVHWRLEEDGGTYVITRDGCVVTRVDGPSLRALYRVAYEAKYRYRYWNLCDLKTVDYDPTQLDDSVRAIMRADLPNGVKARWARFNLAGKLADSGHYDVAFSQSEAAPYLVMGNGCRTACADFEREPACDIEVAWPSAPPEMWQYQAAWVANYIRDNLVAGRALFEL